MTWTRSKIVASVAVSLLSAATVFYLLDTRSRRNLPTISSAPPRPGVTSPSSPPFRFSRPVTQSPEQAMDLPDSARTDLAGFTSNIPVIVLRSTPPGRVSASMNYSSFQMQIYEPGTNQPASLGHDPQLTMPVGLRLHGMVSRRFPKLSYRLRLQNEGGGTRDRPLLGMPADDDWILQGPWLDKSLVRNAFSYDLARAMGCLAMRTRACEVFLNTSGRPVSEADYIGVYQLTERIERGTARVSVTKLGPEMNVEPAVTGGYILAWDVGQGSYLPTWKSIQVKYPNEPSAEQIAWIDGAFTQFDQALKGEDYRDPNRGYAAHIEVDDWVNYLLFEELVLNLDAYSRSFYLMKDRGGKIRPGPVWDHDLAMGHQFPAGTSLVDWWFIKRMPPHDWGRRLMTDPAFAARAARRWATLRQGVLRNEAIDARLDAFAAPLLAGPADRNFERWKVLNVLHPFTEAPYITFATATYPEQIVALKNFLHERAAWMDGKLAETNPIP
jgi:hypothetical protein